jgi:hypothetical protein
VLGAFHEFSVVTADIRASVEFYERLGFTQCLTGDAWLHPYAVVSDGQVCVGLHQDPQRVQALTFVHAEVARLCSELERRQLPLTYRRIDPEVFNHIGLKDPAGEQLIVVEARTFSPPDREPTRTSVLGNFNELSLPAADFGVMQRFWESLGFVAVGQVAEPWPHLVLTSDTISLAFHSRALLDRPALVYAQADMSERIARLRELAIPEHTALPGGLDPASHALFAAPEGTLLALITEAD